MLTSAQYRQLSEVPSAIEWFANIDNPQARRSPQIAQTMTKMKKDELVESANAKLSGLRWLPDNLKVKAPQE